MSTPLPQGPLVAFYGDDFTGATAVMEVMAFAGLETILFLGPPSAAQLDAHRHMRCIGIAGTARAQTPAWMDAHLPAFYRDLRATGAPLLHYKVCSTFDSAPHIGSIGRAIDLGAAVLGGSAVPVVVGAPDMGRYQTFGTLFAAVDGVPYRIDRHPVMARHPVTPMDEADLRQHLARQTGRRIGLIDLASLHRGAGDAIFAAEAGADCPALFIDVADARSQAEAGALLWANRRQAPFIAGSQGVEYALIAHWRAAGLIPAAAPVAPVPPVARIAAVSGSCSPVTAAQIRHAGRNGFAAVRLDLARIADPRAFAADTERAVADALAQVSESRQSPLVYSALGPDDPAVSALASATAAAGIAVSEANRRIGNALGTILIRLIDQTGVRRVAIAGGDTSGEAMAVLGIDALAALAPLVPGAPLCRSVSSDPTMNGLELTLKGGQMGTESFFSQVRGGAAA